MVAFPGVSDQVERFVFRLLSTGLVLGDLVCALAEALPADAYPGEEPTAVVLEMLCGTIATALGSVDTSELLRAAELIELAHDRSIEHLQLARGLSSRIHGDDEGPGRGYG